MGNCLSSEKPVASEKPHSSANRVPASTTGNAQSSYEPKTDELKSNYSMSNNNSISNTQPGSVSSHDVVSSSPSGSAHLNADNSALSGSKGNSLQNSTSNNTTAQTTPPHSNNAIQDTSKRPEVKIILMGSGESGKSTILKQMKIIHQNGYSQDDLLMYKTTIYKNLLDCAKIIVNALDQFGIDLNTPSSTDSNTTPTPSNAVASSDSTAVSITNHEANIPSSTVSTINNSIQPETEAKESAALAPATNSNDMPYISKDELELIKHSVISADLESVFDPTLAAIIIKLWAHPYVKEMYRTRRSQFYIMDSASYFFSNVQRISEMDYIPNVTDILRARIKTTGIYETRFQMGRLNIHMYDVGGQRSERKKWIHCFDDVTVIIFCVALSEYDQVLLEETSQNRMAESLVLFDSIINSRWFVRTSVVLFLNKIDVFTEKLEMSPLENYFSDYTGGPVVKNAAKYILWRFTKLNRNKLNIYPHITQATDTSNIRLVFAAVKEAILQNSLRDSGLL